MPDADGDDALEMSGDTAFVTALESGSLPLEAFDHRAHLRAGFVYLRRHDFPQASVAMKTAIVGFATRIGKPTLYHETLTLAYLALIAERMADEPADIDFATFYARYPELGRVDYFRRYYPAGELDDPQARRTFVLPRPRGA